MSGSDSEWGELAAHDSELADTWDSFGPLPGPDHNIALDAFVESKRLTHGALVRIGTRLANPTTLVYAGPAYLKFRDLITGKRWSYAESSWTQLKVVRARIGLATTVLVAEGESDSARLSDGYPGCDVAILPAGAGYFPATYAEQLRAYEQVLVALDADTAGEKGAAQVLEALPHAQRFAPPPNDDADWCGAEELPPLPEPEAPRTVVGGILFEDLTALLNDDIPEPEVLVDDLVYTEGVHWIQGHPGAGKTTLAMYIAILVMLEGRHVVWLDYEGGTRPTVRRLLACECPVEIALERFHYAGWPPAATELMGDIVAHWPDALIVLDSASKGLQAAGLDENSPGDVTKWAAPMVKACKQAAFPVIVIDHVTKNATRETRYSRGAGSKLADTDVAWFVETLEPFNRDKVGSIRVNQQKDREGFLPFTNYYQVGDGRGRLPVVAIDAPDEPVEDRPGDPAI